MESIYVGAFQIFSNAYDFKIDFSSVEPVIDENGNIIKEEKIVKCRVAMSPTMARELAQKLSGMADEYEKRFGKVPDLTQNNKE